MFNNNFYFLQICVSSCIECNYKVTVNTYLSFIISIILVGDQYQRCNHLNTLYLLESICLMEHRIEQRNITTSDGSILMKVSLDLYNVCCGLNVLRSSMEPHLSCQARGVPASQTDRKIRV